MVVAAEAVVVVAEVEAVATAGGAGAARVSVREWPSPSSGTSRSESECIRSSVAKASPITEDSGTSEPLTLRDPARSLTRPCLSSGEECRLVGSPSKFDCDCWCSCCFLASDSGGGVGGESGESGSSW